MTPAERDQLRELEAAVLGMRFPMAAMATMLVLGGGAMALLLFVLAGAVTGLMTAGGMLLLGGAPTVTLAVAAGYALLARAEPASLATSLRWQVAFWWSVVVAGMGSVGAVVALLVAMSLAVF